MSRYQTGPSMFRGPWRALTTTYGIDNSGEIFVRRSFFGWRFGEDQSVPMEQVTRKTPSGSLFGSIAFGEGSHDPVTWVNLFRPREKFKAISRVLEQIEERDQPTEPTGPPWHQNVQLADTLIAVGNIPERLGAILYNIHGSPFAHSSEPMPGAFVRKDEPLLTFTGTSYPCIRAPIDCQVQWRVIAREDTAVASYTDEVMPARLVAAVVIRPVVGATLQSSNISGEFEDFLRSSGLSKRLNPPMMDIDTVVQDAADDLSIWKKHALRALPLAHCIKIDGGSSQPHFDEDVKWVQLKEP